MYRLLSLPVLAASMVLANPAIAEERESESELAQKLGDPEFQEELSGKISGFMSMIMTLPIGEVVHSLEKAVPDNMRGDSGFSDIDRNATVGDLARRDDPDFDRNFENKMRQGTAMMGFMASEFGALLPELRAMTERMKKHMDGFD